MKVILVIAGTISVILGVVGIFLPLLPTTPFLLLAAACYVKASPKLYSWLINNKHLGSYIRNYREGKGIPLKTKSIAIVLLWSTISLSAVLVSRLYISTFLLIVAICVTIHLLRIKTFVKD
jgi:uncharacterized membrane protein YbaN (DUF454 family)